MSPSSKNIVTSESESNGSCVGPKSLPWKSGPLTQCFRQIVYLTFSDNCHFRVILCHCLTLEGRRAGQLLYSTTLLPGEKQKIYTYDRYRRIRKAEERMSIQTSFKQSMSALSKAQQSSNFSLYGEEIKRERSSKSASASAFGLFGGSASSSSDTISHSGFDMQASSSRFALLAQSASHAVETERSIVISNYEEADHREALARVIENKNECKAVTYYFRRIYDCYVFTSHIEDIEIYVARLKRWISISEIGRENIAKDCKDEINKMMELWKKSREPVTCKKEILIPADGTVVETELAYCSSCDEGQQSQIKLDNQLKETTIMQRQAETKLIELEAERRGKLLKADNLEPFMLVNEENSNLEPA